jgi:hypothetical protein
MESYTVRRYLVFSKCRERASVNDSSRIPFAKALESLSEFDDFVAGAHGHDRRVETIVDGVVVGCV